MKKILFLFTCLIIIMSITGLALEKVEIGTVGFDKVYPSYSDIVVVENDGLTGIVDRFGKTVVPFGNYLATMPDSQGRVATVQNAVSTVYDKNGKVLAEFKNETIISTADGICVSVTPVEFLSDGTLVSRVRYVELDSGKVIYESENGIAATGFSDGYASVQKTDCTVIINTLGAEIFSDTTPLEPIGCPASDIATFKAIDEYGDASYYIIDIKNKKRICVGGFDEFDNVTNFTETRKEIENIDGFYLFRDSDNREVPILDGIFAPIIEDPEYFNRDCLIIRDGEIKETIDDITTFYVGEKYLFYDNFGLCYYYTRNGEIVVTDYEGATGFFNGRAIMYCDGGYVFVDNDFNEVTEPFGGFVSTHLYGEIFCGLTKGKYYFITISNGSTPSIPSTPSTPSTPSIPVTDKSGMKNFVKIASYNSLVFPDVKEKDWFVKNVALAYETGLMNGKGDGFAPQDNLTVAQVITMAARLNSIYRTGKAEFVQGKVWYQVYVDYCVGNGIIGKEDFDNYDRNTTRAEFVRILSRAIPETEFETKNGVSGIPDVTSSDKDYNSILMFYRAGILSGSDSAHNFKPKSEITRAETAAIITRIIDKTLRVNFEIK